MSLKPGRNSLCMCGSGKKYKKCCGKSEYSPQVQSQQQMITYTVVQKRSLKGSAPAREEFNQLVALLNVGSYVELERQARLQVEQYPDFGPCWKMLSVSLLKQGKDALLALEKTATLLPEDATGHCNLGIFLLHMNRLDEAEASLCRAIQIKTDFADAHNNLGGIYLTRGRFDKAEACFRRALQVSPDNLNTRFNLASIRKVEAGDENLAALESVEKKMRNGILPLSDKDAIFMHFALGKSYDDIGEYEKAFQHFIEGCRLKRSTFEYNSEKHTQDFTRIMRSFDLSAIDRLRGGGDPSRLPIFILGMPRSGTTLIEQIISSHPQVHGAGELHDLMAIARRYVTGTPFPENVRLLNQEQLTSWGAEYVAGLQRRMPDVQCITNKMPENFIIIGMIHLMLPNAKIIHVNRNPADTCLSCFTTLFEHNYTNNLVELGRYYVDYARLMEHWRRVLPDGAFLDIQYEDVVADQETQSRRIIEYCGLEWNDACLDFHRNKRSVNTASVTQVRRRIYKSSVERWRHYEKFLDPLFDALGELAPNRHISV